MKPRRQEIKSKSMSKVRKERRFPAPDLEGPMIGSDIRSLLMMDESWLSVETKSRKTIENQAIAASRSRKAQGNIRDLGTQLIPALFSKQKKTDAAAVKARRQNSATESFAEMLSSLESFYKAERLVRRVKPTILILPAPLLAKPVSEILTALDAASKKQSEYEENARNLLQRFVEITWADVDETGRKALTADETVAKPAGFTAREWNSIIDVTTSEIPSRAEWSIESVGGSSGLLSLMQTWREEVLSDLARPALKPKQNEAPVKKQTTVEPDCLATPAFVFFTGYHTRVGRILRELRIKALRKISLVTDEGEQKLLKSLLATVKQHSLEHGEMHSQLPNPWNDSHPSVQFLVSRLDWMQNQFADIASHLD